jgi:fatty-acyl-CoA synthase
MTECAGVVTVEPFHGERCPGSTGLRLPFTQVRAFALREGGADLAAPCAADETGVIALRGPNVAPGYTDPAKNAGTFEQGWLVSGDLGHVDAQGRVFVTGRAKDVIIRGAHNIDPQMIEEALLRHPAVAVAAAVGRPDSYAGELPVAFVSLKPGAEVTGHELVAFVAPLVAEPAAAPKSVTILPEIPLTPIGKMFKPALRAIATRAAIGDALRAAGLRDGSWDVEGEGSSWRIAVADAAAVAARDATVGMPLAIEIVAR